MSRPPPRNAAAKRGIRIRIGLALALAVMLSLVAVAALGIRRLDDGADVIQGRVLPSLKLASTLRADLQDVRRLESQDLLVTPGEAQQQEQRIVEARREMADALRAYEGVLADGQDRRNWQDARDRIAAYDATWPALRAAARRAQADQRLLDDATAVLRGESQQRFIEAAEAVEHLSQYNVLLTGHASARASAAHRRAVLLMTALAVLAAVLTASLGWLLARSIRRPPAAGGSQARSERVGQSMLAGPGAVPPAPLPRPLTPVASGGTSANDSTWSDC